VAESFDVAIIGGGHNGLVAAAYLGRAGKRVLVLERRPAVGGAVATEEIAPGFRGSTGADICGLLRPEIVRDLDLAARGIQFLPLDPEVIALGDGTSQRIWRDRGRTAAELAAKSSRDAEAYPRFVAMLRQFAGALDPLLTMTPPNVAAPNLGEQMGLLRRALAVRRLGKAAMQQMLRLPPMAVRDLLNEWFETELLKASLAVDALLGTFQGPWSPGTAFGLIHHFLPSVHESGWAFVRGGMGTLAAALATSARSAGATIRTEAEVTRVLCRVGRVTGLQLADGETIGARAVASNADPKRTFLHLVDPEELSPEFLLRVRNIEMNGVVAKVNLALDGAPRVPVAGNGLPPHVRIAPTLEYIERAYDDAKYGSVSKAPFLDVFIPSAVDPDLAPPGKHVLSALVQYAPYDLRPGDWTTERDKLGDRVIGILEEHLPGLERQIVGRSVLTPRDLEARFGLTEGHIYHGEMTLDQFLVLRPVPGWSQYRTPVEGLYLCGSGAHPGGGITGAPGYNAAREILADWPRIAAASD
jgi:phytoene dehydrogenase-like protein